MSYFLAFFFLRTRKAPHPSAGNEDQLLVGLLPVLPVSQGLMWACPWLLFCLAGEVMSRSLCVCSLLGRMSRKLQAGPSPYTLPGLGELSPTAQYMYTWVHPYMCLCWHTHTLTVISFSGHSYTWFSSSSSRPAASQRDLKLHPLQPQNSGCGELEGAKHMDSNQFG